MNRAFRLIALMMIAGIAILAALPLGGLALLAVLREDGMLYGPPLQSFNPRIWVPAQDYEPWANVVGFAPALWILFSFILLGLFLCLGLAAWRILSPPAQSKSDRFEAEEARLLQELYRGFSKLETRVEALETILLNKSASSTRDPEWKPW